MKKLTKVLLCIALALSLALCAVGCNKREESESPLTLATDSITVCVGEQANVSQVLPSGKSGKFAAADTAGVVKLDGETLQAIGLGSAVVTVRDGNNVGKLTVHVTDKLVTDSALTLAVGETKYLSATLASGKEPSLTVTLTGAEGIVALDGIAVTAEGVGTTTLTLTDSESGLETTVTVTVADSIDLPASITVPYGSSRTLEPTLTSGAAASFTYEVSGKSGVIALSGATISTIAIGESEITVKSGSLTKVVAVTVTDAFDVGSGELHIVLGETERVESTLSSGTSANVYYEVVGEQDIVEITSAGIKGIALGETIVKATEINTGNTALIEVKVTDAMYVSVGDSTIKIGEYYAPDVTLKSGANVIADYAIIGEDGIARITSQGVRGVAPGTVTVRIIARGTGLSKSYSLTVTDILELENENKSVRYGEEFTVGATLTSGNDSVLEYEVTAGASVLQITGGKIHAIGVGEAEVTVTETATLLTGVCHVTVSDYLVATNGKTKYLAVVGDAIVPQVEYASGGALGALSYESSGSAVTVSGTTITAAAEGNATVTITEESGARFEIEVEVIVPYNLALSAKPIDRDGEATSFLNDGDLNSEDYAWHTGAWIYNTGSYVAGWGGEHDDEVIAQNIWVGYEFAEKVRVSEIRLHAHHSYPYLLPWILRVQVSDDGSTWSQVTEYTCPQGELTPQVISFDAVECKYIRAFMVRPQGKRGDDPYFFYIAEFEVYGVPAVFALDVPATITAAVGETLDISGALGEIAPDFDVTVGNGRVVSYADNVLTFTGEGSTTVAIRERKTDSTATIAVRVLRNLAPNAAEAITSSMDAASSGAECVRDGDLFGGDSYTQGVWISPGKTVYGTRDLSTKDYYVGYRFEETMRAYAVKVYPWQGVSFFPDEFRIDVSDNGTDWTQVATYERAHDELKAHTVEFTPTECKYIRVYMLTAQSTFGGDGYVVMLSEVQVLGEPTVGVFDFGDATSLAVGETLSLGEHYSLVDSEFTLTGGDGYVTLTDGILTAVKAGVADVTITDTTHNLQFEVSIAVAKNVAPSAATISSAQHGGSTLSAVNDSVQYGGSDWAEGVWMTPAAVRYVDNDMSSLGYYVGYGFEYTTEVYSLRLYPHMNYEYLFPNKVRIEKSDDGVTYTAVTEYERAHANRAPHVITLSEPVDCKYIRVFILNAQSTFGDDGFVAGISEIEVLGVVVGSELDFGDSVTLGEGEAFTLAEHYSIPENTLSVSVANNDGTVTFTDSVIVAKQVGTATVTVTDEATGYTKTFTVTVKRNIARGAAVTTSVSEESGNFGAKYLNDGNTAGSTAWQNPYQSSWHPGNWGWYVGYDFKYAASVDAIALYPSVDPEYFVASWSIETSSDGTNWTEAGTYNDPTPGSALPRKVEFDSPIDCRYLRVYPLSGGLWTEGNGTLVRIAEITALGEITEEAIYCPRSTFVMLPEQAAMFKLEMSTGETPDWEVTEDNDGVVTFDSERLRITAVKAGTAAITFRDKNTNLSQTINVTVKDRTENIVLDTGWWIGHNVPLTHDSIQQQVDYLVQAGVDECGGLGYGYYYEDQADLQQMLAEAGIVTKSNAGLNTESYKLTDQELYDAFFESEAEPLYSGGIVNIDLKDEPPQPNEWAETFRRLQELFPGTRIHLNNYPDIWGDGYYYDKIDDWARMIYDTKYQYLSFDNYCFPITPNTVDEYNCFKHFDTFRRVGLERGINTACWIQSVGLGQHYRWPESGTLRYHMMVALSYGIKKMHMFTWGPPDWEDAVTQYTPNAIIDEDGNPTVLFDTFCDISPRVHAMGTVLAKCDAVEVYHTGNRSGQTDVYDKLPHNPYIATENNNVYAIISIMKHRETGRNYVMIVNKDIVNTQRMRIGFYGTGISEVSQTDGSLNRLTLDNGSAYTFEIEAGGAVLVALDEGKDWVITPKETVESDNILEGKYAVASSSRGLDGWFVSRAFDGKKFSEDRSLGWRTESTEDKSQMIMFDLKGSYGFNRLDLYPARTGELYGLFFPRYFKLEYSDDKVNWTTALEREHYKLDKTTVPSFTFPKATARYVRLTVDELDIDMSYYVSEIAEICLYNDTGNIGAPPDSVFDIPVYSPDDNIALGKPVYDYSGSVEYVDWNLGSKYLTDGMKGDYYTYAFVTGTTAGEEYVPQWATINLVNEFTVNRVVLHGWFTNTGTGLPVDFEIRVSTDGVNFTTVATVTGNDPTQNEPVEVMFNPTVAKYVRVYATRTSYVGESHFAGYQLALEEIEIYGTGE